MKPTLPILLKKEKGQILVIMALIFIGLVAIIGLAVDLGYMYVSYARLRRAVDAAALGATTQFKKNVQSTDLQKAAREFLIMNGVPDDISVNALVDTCTSTKLDTARFPGGAGDPTLCTTPPRKLVRVTASENVPMFFMSVVGIPSVPISVTSTSEAAAVDLVLVIDRSDSMGRYKPDLVTLWPQGQTDLDPTMCNNDLPNKPGTWVPDNTPNLWVGDCHPFHEVKAAAFSFIDTFMDPEYDRIAIVVFDQHAYRVNFGTVANPVYLLGINDNANAKAILLDAVRKLWLYDGVPNGGVDNRSPINHSADGMVCPWAYPDGPLPGDTTPLCRLHDGSGGYYILDCPGAYYGPDFSLCGVTNMGEALNWAAVILQQNGRQESLWATIVLTDGVPNIGFTDQAGIPTPICPQSPEDTRIRDPYCSDMYPRAAVRRKYSGAGALPAGYDIMDYVMDQADVLAVNAHSIIFSIGLGPEVLSPAFSAPGEPPMGETALNYIASAGQTGNYYQGSAAQLRQIFLTIANKIGTRLTK